MLPSLIYLIDTTEALCSAWEDAFSNVACVIVRCGDFFEQESDAMVSPANSFGIMDGGLDAAIQSTLLGDVQSVVQERILNRYHGELPVGCAEIVQTKDDRWPYLIAAPTMRIPESVSHTLNPYLAFRAALLAISSHNEAIGVADIASVVVPGLGTGIGGVDPIRCAFQMRMAFNAVSAPARNPSFA
ncbi:MAG: macro domain-containing protein, partial [Verrucomicrobiales bacterium]